MGDYPTELCSWGFEIMNISWSNNWVPRLMHGVAQEMPSRGTLMIGMLDTAMVFTSSSFAPKYWQQRDVSTVLSPQSGTGGR